MSQTPETLQSTRHGTAAPSKLTIKLNPMQREAATHGNGALLILAGAGSGKTSTMAFRMAHLIADRNIPADAILGLSFTNKAAKELRERVRHILVKSMGTGSRPRTPLVTTFHSLCARLLRKHADRLGFQTNFTILDQHDQSDVIKQILKNTNLDDRKFDSDVILFEIGQAKNRFLTPEQAQDFFLEGKRLAPDYALATASCFGKYQEQLKTLNAMDFDDLIYHTVHLLEQDTEVRDLYNYKFRHLLVDEYQDTNAAQFRILSLLTQKHQNLCVVGDDDQSIYSWRGADPSHILGFKKYYPEAKVIMLEQNYRSTSKILEAANKVIAQNRGRYAKTLWSDRGEGESITELVVEDDRAESDAVADEILKRIQDQSRTWGEFAILYRSNAQSRLFEEALRRKRIPYKIVGGLSFLARKEVKNALAYWKLIANPKDDASFRRIINWPARGIGRTSLEAVSQFAFQKKISLWEAIQMHLDLVDLVQPKALAAFERFEKTIHTLRTKLDQLGEDPQAVSQWAKESLETLELRTAVTEDTEDPAQAARKWENVEELVHSLGQQTKPTPEDDSYHPDLVAEEKSGGLLLLRDFLNRMTLEAQEAEKDQDENDKKDAGNQVTLLTLHGAKGLEFPIVFLVGMEEGYLPHKRTLDEAVDFSEERRLCYVGITRAKDLLYLVRAKNRIRYGKPTPRTPSRFLAEIPQDLIVHIDESSTPDLSRADVKIQHEERVKNYLAEIRAKLQGK